jgi:hypothetical protein
MISSSAQHVRLGSSALLQSLLSFSFEERGRPATRSRFWGGRGGSARGTHPGRRASLQRPERTHPERPPAPRPGPTEPASALEAAKAPAGIGGRRSAGHRRRHLLTQVPRSWPREGTKRPGTAETVDSSRARPRGAGEGTCGNLRRVRGPQRRASASAPSLARQRAHRSSAAPPARTAQRRGRQGQSAHRKGQGRG